MTSGDRNVHRSLGPTRASLSLSPQSNGVILIPPNEYNSAESARRNREKFYADLMKVPALGSDVTVLPSKTGLPRRKVATGLKGNSIPSYGLHPTKLCPLAAGS